MPSHWRLSLLVDVEARNGPLEAWPVVIRPSPAMSVCGWSLSLVALQKREQQKNKGSLSTMMDIVCRFARRALFY